MPHIALYYDPTESMVIDDDSLLDDIDYRFLLEAMTLNNNASQQAKTTSGRVHEIASAPKAG